MSKFNIEEFIKKEINEYEREYKDYLKIKALYGFNNNKRTYEEMLNKKIIIESPEPSKLPIPSKNLLTNN